MKFQYVIVCSLLGFIHTALYPSFQPPKKVRLDKDLIFQGYEAMVEKYIGDIASGKKRKIPAIPESFLGLEAIIEKFKSRQKYSYFIWDIHAHYTSFRANYYPNIYQLDQGKISSKSLLELLDSLDQIFQLTLLYGEYLKNYQERDSCIEIIDELIEWFSKAWLQLAHVDSKIVILSLLVERTYTFPKYHGFKYSKYGKIIHNIRCHATRLSSTITQKEYEIVSDGICHRMVVLFEINPHDGGIRKYDAPNRFGDSIRDISKRKVIGDRTSIDRVLTLPFSEPRRVYLEKKIQDGFVHFERLRKSILDTKPRNIFQQRECKANCGTYAALMTTVHMIEREVQSLFSSSLLSSAIVTRPPGHHADGLDPNGFCYHNNAVFAYREAKRLNPEALIIIVDFDLHHGNGTAQMLQGKKDVFILDLFRKNNVDAPPHVPEFYPFGTDYRKLYNHTIKKAANLVLKPLPKGIQTEQYLQALEEGLHELRRKLPKEPDLVIYSAGYDGTSADNKNLFGGEGFLLGPKSYFHIVRNVAAFFPASKKLLLVEGGYTPSVLSECIEKSVQALEYQ